MDVIYVYIYIYIHTYMIISAASPACRRRRAPREPGPYGNFIRVQCYNIILHIINSSSSSSIISITNITTISIICCMLLIIIIMRAWAAGCGAAQRPMICYIIKTCKIT